MTVVEQVKERMTAFDPSALHVLLESLDAGQRRATRTWAAKETTFFDELSIAAYRIEKDEHGRDRRLVGAAPWMRTMCLLATSPPAEAARHIRWTSLLPYMRPEAKEHASLLLAARPRAWARTFLTTAAAIRMPRGGGWDQGESLAHFVARGLADHDLPCPDGSTFLEYYLRDGWTQRVDADRLRSERLVPDLVHLMIEHGFAGNLAEMGAMLPELVADGTIDRDRVIGSCLVALTAETRTASQRSVARALAGLDLRPDEVPGGLAYLTGSIATSVGTVGLVLLPRALALVEDDAGLDELVRTIAGRPERRQKRMLLAALREPALVGRVGRAGVLTALDVLSSGEEDSGLLEEVEKARRELDADQVVADPGPLLGLWDQTFDPGPPVSWPWWFEREQRWQLHIRRPVVDRAGFAELAVGAFLHDVAERGPRALEETCRQLRQDGELVLSRVPALVEQTFLAGGLRTLWPAALAVADDVAGAGRILPGLPELLRLLTRYAPEVPAGTPLPAQLARLARDDGRTSAQLEARTLAAALRVTTDRIADEEAPVRGLWDLRPRTLALPRLLHQYVEVPRSPIDDGTLSYCLDVGPDRRRGRCEGEVCQLDAQLVSILAREVQWFGLDAIRPRVASILASRGGGHGPTLGAVEAWASGRLTAESYAEVISDDRARRSGQDRVVFAWTCEQLVRLDRHAGSLSAPTTVDGGVLVPDLAERIHHLAGAAEVGPVDLLLGLTRLRVTGTEEDAEASASLTGVRLCTDAVVSGGRGFDVVPLVRARLRDGGGPVAEALERGDFGPLSVDDVRGPATHPDVRRRIHSSAAAPGEGRSPGPHRSRYFGLADGRVPADLWDHLLAGLLSEHEHRRRTSGRHIAALTAHDGVLDARVTLPPALALLDAGELPLSRLVDGLAWLAERGGLQVVWPLGLGVAAAAVERRPKPHGLAFLLGTLASYVSEVPAEARALPSEILALAASSGRTKSHLAARDLVAAAAPGAVRTR